MTTVNSVENDDNDASQVLESDNIEILDEVIKKITININFLLPTFKLYLIFNKNS